MQGTSLDALFERLGLGHDLGGNRAVVGREFDHARIQAAPDVAELPGARQDFLGPPHIVAVPVIDDGGQLCLRGEVDHVRGLADAEHAARLGDLQGRRGIGVLEDHVCALVDQRLGRLGLLARVVPGADPDHLDGRLRVNLAQGQSEGVDAADYLGNREGADVADHVRLGHAPGDGTRHGPAFVEAGHVGAEVLRLLVASGVLEAHLGELLGDLDGRVHVAERGGEDEVAPFAAI